MTTKKINFMTEDEITHSCGGIVGIEDLSDLIYKNVLTKAERESLTPEELEIRKRIHKRKTGYRYRLKHPEKYAEKREKLNTLSKERSQAKKEKKAQTQAQVQVDSSDEELVVSEEEVVMTPPPKKKPTSKGARKEITEACEAKAEPSGKKVEKVRKTK